MDKPFKEIFSFFIAIALLVIYTSSVFYMIFFVVANCPEPAKCSGIDFGEGFNFVNTIGGLVSALVIAQLAVTMPGKTPRVGLSSPRSDKDLFYLNIAVGSYLLIWVLTGLSSFIIGVILYQKASIALSNIGSNWLGLAVAATYSYLRIEPDKLFTSKNLARLSKETHESLLSDLEVQIRASRIIFDNGSGLKEELLGQNAGTKITPKLQNLILELSKVCQIRISSLMREQQNNTLHSKGRAVDIGNEEIAHQLLEVVANDQKIIQLAIDEIIFDAAVAGEQDRNLWNYNGGKKHVYNEITLNSHKNHIHFAVTA